MTTENVVIHGDCIEVMATLDAESIDAIVTDPPYGLEFMGKEWDRLGAGAGYGAIVTDRANPHLRHAVVHGSGPNPTCRTCGGLRSLNAEGSGGRTKCRCEMPDFPNYVLDKQRAMQEWHERWAREAYRVAKPGAHLLAFGGSRTVHRLAAAIEDAGWEIRDMLIWSYASGFPKSLNVSSRLAAEIPDDARCACAPRSRKTALGSPGGYRGERGSDDGRPLPALGSDRAPAPSQDGALGRSRGGRRGDDPGLGLGHTPDPASTGPRPIAGSDRAMALPLGEGRADGSSPSDTASSMSLDGPTAARRNLPRTRRTSRSGGASSDPAWTPPNGDRFPYYKCTTCGGWAVEEGFGTALKPAFEPIVLARKPLRGTVAANVQAFGTGALNIDGCRIGTAGGTTRTEGSSAGKARNTLHGGNFGVTPLDAGRWPANLILTDPIFDGDVPGVVGGGMASAGAAWEDRERGEGRGILEGQSQRGRIPLEATTYSRYFLIPKADRADREPVLGGLPHRSPASHNVEGRDMGNPRNAMGDAERRRIERGEPGIRPRANVHPTVKPTELMRHLVRLVTPPGGLVLDPFLGSGTTALAAEMEGFRWLGIEREEEYVRIAEARLNGTQRGLGLVG